MAHPLTAADLSRPRIAKELNELSEDLGGALARITVLEAALGIDQPADKADPKPATKPKTTE